MLEPLSRDRYLFRFSGGANLRAKYLKAIGLLRLNPETGAMGAVFERGLDAMLRRIDPACRHARRQPRRAPAPAKGAAKRAIPRAVRDQVWTRDQGRCTFVGPDGQRCPATVWLEIDHVIPFAFGGRSDDAANLRLMCRAHNLLLARRVFGASAAKQGSRR